MLPLIRLGDKLGTWGGALTPGLIADMQMLSLKTTWYQDNGFLVPETLSM